MEVFVLAEAAPEVPDIGFNNDVRLTRWFRPADVRHIIRSLRHEDPPLPNCCALLWHSVVVRCAGDIAVPACASYRTAALASAAGRGGYPHRTATADRGSVAETYDGGVFAVFQRLAFTGRNGDW